MEQAVDFLYQQMVNFSQSGHLDLFTRSIIKTQLQDPNVMAEVRSQASIGNARAEYVLGYAYALGQGSYWFRQAAHQGHADAQFNLGFLYGLGQGVVQDNRIAYDLFDLAVANGSQAVLSARDQVAQQLSPADLNAAEQLAAMMAQEKQVTGPINQFLASHQH